MLFWLNAEYLLFWKNIAESQSFDFVLYGLLQGCSTMGEKEFAESWSPACNWFYAHNLRVIAHSWLTDVLHS